MGMKSGDQPPAVLLELQRNCTMRCNDDMRGGKTVGSGEANGKNRENLEKLVQANVKLLKMLGSPIFVCCISLKNSIYNNQIGAYL